MLLSREEAELVFRLHCALMQFVMKRVQAAGVPSAAANYPSRLASAPSRSDLSSVLGERACPPEDVGGIRGCADYLEAIAAFSKGSI